VPPKSASVPPKSASVPPKSASVPPKSASVPPKSASVPPKSSSVPRVALDTAAEPAPPISVVEPAPEPAPSEIEVSVESLPEMELSVVGLDELDDLDEDWTVESARAEDAPERRERSPATPAAATPAAATPAAATEAI